MTSSMLTGDRRWASSKRGGMTVLGKVTVPKPINLPSQRLENHGLDPNVEIVPKGTLSWGSRSSSATNAWGSSSLSPHADGGTSSPRHLSGRPSSGGSGTRPSTAGSERAHDSSNARGPNSRPSSASGPPTANHTSSSRPHSAETRPGSSQLSRFAEPMTENLGGWGSAAAAEKLGLSHPKREEFSLTSGDFPTLGSDKDKSERSSESQVISSSGHPKEKAGDIPANIDQKGEPGHYWRRDNPPYSEDGIRPGVDKWQGNPLPYPNAHFPPHYEAWRAPPVNSPQGGGIWFRGPPGGPPFGGPVPPSGFPVEPFPYYQPHLPPAALSNAPPVPPPVTGPRGHHPKNGDVYRPQIPDAYIRPGMPMRPGFYPGPVAYEGYYGPPMGYCSSNERDVPFMGMMTGPSVYNRYPSQNPPEAVNPHSMPGGYNSSGNRLISDQMEGNCPQDSGGPYKVLMKQHNDWDGKNDHQQWVDSSNVPPVTKSDRQGMSPRNAEQKSEEQRDENRNCSSLPLRAKPAHSIGSHKTSATSTALKLDESAPTADGSVALPSAPRDPSLMQKIEGLNAKARDGSSAKIRIEGNNFPGANAKINFSEDEVVNENASANPISRNGDKNLESVPSNETSSIRPSTHGMRGKNDHHLKERLNSQDADGWRRKNLGIDTPASSAVQPDSIRVAENHGPCNANEKPGPFNHCRHDGGGSGQILYETSDADMQRAKMKELAKQRTKQLQEEEEERTRRQRAKALAKLEELNRRTQGMDGSTMKLEDSKDFNVQNKQGESSISDLMPISSKPMEESSDTVHDSDVSQSAEISSSKVEISSVLTCDTATDARKSVANESAVMCKDSTPLDHFVDNSDVSHHDNAPQILTNIANKHRRVSHRHKQNVLFEESSVEKFVSNQEIIPKVETGSGTVVVVPSAVVTKDISLGCASTTPVDTNLSVDLALHQKKKNKNGKNKPTVEETLRSSTTFTSKEGCTADTSKLKTADFEPDPYSVMQLNSSKDALSEQHASSPNEEYYPRTSNPLKSQQSRRFPRNTQATNRPGQKFNGSDSVIWAPVKSQSKTEIASESSNKDDIEVQEVSFAKNDEQQQNNLKNRRAEKEIYIPKPVAKEKAQQGSVHTSAANQITADEIVEISGSSSRGTESIEPLNSNVGKDGSGAEPRNVTGRQNKHGKTQGSWRQRGTSELTAMHDLHDGSSFSMNSNKGVQRSTEQHQGLKSDESTIMEGSKSTNQLNVSETIDNREKIKRITHDAIPNIKDQAVTVRERRHSHRGQKDVGVKPDNDHKTHNLEVDNSGVPHPSVEPNQAAMSAASKENQSFTDRATSHWRPKSPALPSNNMRGSGLGGVQNVGAQIGRPYKKDASLHVDPLLPAPKDKQAFDVFQPRHDHYLSKRSKGGESQNREALRDGKDASLNGRPSSPDKGFVNLLEQVPTRMDFRHEQRSSSGFRRNLNNSGRISRGHESRMSQNLPAHESNLHNQPGNRERQGQNVQHDYQPVRPYNSNNFERPRDVNQSGPRARERGNRSRRGGGNLYCRQSSAIRVDAGYE